MGKGTKEVKEIEKTPPPNGEKAIAKKEEETALSNYAPDESWQIRETGEERMFWVKEVGAVIQGIVADTDSWTDERGDDRLFLKVQLTQPTMVVGAKKGETEGVPRKAKKGELIWLGITHGLMPLYKEVCETRRVLEVAVKAKKLVDLGKGQTVWRYAYAVKPTKQVKLERFKDLAKAETAFDEGDAPF